MEFLDWLVVGCYFLMVFGIAFFAAYQERKKAETASGYFLANRHASWWIIGASLFAANIGSEHLVGLAGAGASTGVAMGQFELFAAPCLLILAWVFTPFFLKNGVFTMPEFLERRYSSTARWYLAIVSIIAYVLTKISVIIFAGGIVFETLMHINFWYGATIVVLATGAYTFFGGLRAVLYTDFMQIFVIIIGSFLLTAFGLHKLGGWSEVQSIAGPEMLNMWKPMTDPNFPWTGIVFGVLVIGIWYWCTDQFIVQRVLSARNIDHARGGAIFGGFLKILPLFLFVVPGLIAYCLNAKGMIDLKSPDQALPTLILNLLPVGVRGLVVAGLLAALTSSLASVFNSCSTLITMDVYQRLKPDASQESLVRVGKLSVLFLIALGLAWIPMMKLISGGIYQYLQSVQAYISPPVAAVFLWGILWKRINAKGAVAALFTGFAIGMTRLTLEINKGALPDGLIKRLVEINFLHFGVIIFIVCSLIMVIVSLLTQPLPEKKLEGLTFQTPKADAKEVDQGSLALTISLSVLLCIILVSVWVYFSHLVQH